MRCRIASALVFIAAFAVACGPDSADPALRDRAAFTSRDALTVCAAGSTVKGIDVSEWQGSINWSAVAGAGWTFAYIRISDGSGHLDPYFHSNWTNAHNAGVIRGAYQFFEPGQSASTQAQVVINAVGRLGNGDLPVMMDVETATPTTAELNTWLSAVEAGTGKRPIIYTSAGLWNRWFPSGGFGNFGLFAANWGASCPSLAAGWSNWVFWQYSDCESVSGISGCVDGDRYNGTLAALQGYTNADQAPRGYLDSAACDSIAGWSQDLDAPGQAINVDLYFGGAAGSGVPGTRVPAGTSRQDLCSAIGSCNHGFSFDTPRGLMDGAAHAIHAYGIDANGSSNAELSDSPRTLTCAPAETGVRRHVINPASYSAWGFSSFQDVRPLSDEAFSGFAPAQDWPATPQLIQGTGAPEVYVIDGPFKRHVVSPTSAAAWHLDLGAVQQLPLDQLQAMPTGPALRARPTLIKGSGAEIDVLDDPLPVLDDGSAASSSGSTTGSDGSGSTSGGSTTGGTAGDSEVAGSGSGSSGGSWESSTGASNEQGTTSADSVGGPADPSIDGGCSNVGGGADALALFSVLLFGIRRRRRD